ncbi:MAG: hypothetical protein HQL35_15830 [Alphaproteobacteria bacterium]|nr:hypothetical protein [Alphaproteobacteria bacterium]
MGELISIAKCAKALEIKHRDFSRRLASAGIETFEGKVDVDDVKRIAPNFTLDDQTICETVRLIRQTARRRGAVAPPHKPERELQDDLDRMHNKWLLERKRAQEYRDFVDNLVTHLGQMQESQDPNEAAWAVRLSAWICHQFD